MYFSSFLRKFVQKKKWFKNVKNWRTDGVAYMVRVSALQAWSSNPSATKEGV
jgi:hypothetical protein